MTYRTACLILGTMFLLGLLLSQARPLSAAPPGPLTTALAEEMPVEARLSVVAPLVIDAHRRPIRYWVLAGREFQVELVGHANNQDAVGSAPLLLALALPAGLEHTGGALHLETGEGSGRLPARLVAAEPGEFLILGTVTDQSTGLAAATRILISAVESVDQARAQLKAARQPRPPLPAQAIVDTNPVPAGDQVLQPPAGYAHIHGIVYTYPFASGLSYMLRGIQVQLWEDAATDVLLDTLYTIEPTIDFNYGLTHRNWVTSDGTWVHDDDSGRFDFGNVWVGSGGKDLYFKVRYLFHDGGDGQSGGGLERLAVRNDDASNDPVVESGYTPQHYASGQDSGIVGLQTPLLDGGDSSVDDEAAHIFYDLVKTFTYFRNLAGYTHTHTTAYINYPETDAPNCSGYYIHFNGWDNGYLGYERTDSLVHEYAHSIHYGLRGGSFPPYTPCTSGSCALGTCVGGDCNHGSCANATSSDALIEGWARYVPTRINQDPIYEWGHPISPTWDIRLNGGINALCEEDEWTFGAILYDVVGDVGAGEHLWFDHVAGTLDTHDDDYVHDYYSHLVDDWGQWCGIWTAFESHNVTYASPSLAAPTLSAPANGAQTCDTTPTLDWSDVTDAAAYRVQVDDDSGFTSPAVDWTGDGSAHTPASPLAPGYYLWRALATNACLAGPWSAMRSFTVLAAPAAPAPYWPADGSQHCSPPPYVTWNGVAGAAGYQVQIDDDPAMGSPFVDATTSTTSYPLGPALPLGTSYWRVRASNACGWGPWSPVSGLTYLVAPTTPLLEQPADGSTTCDATPLLDWADVSWATSYRIQVDDDAYFGSPEIDTIKSNSLYNPGVGLASGAYYWRVQAGNFCGDGTWAAPWQFTIQAITENPSLLSPAAGEETCSNRPEFSWSAVPWATSYRLQVDEPPSFSSPSIDIYTPGTTYLSTVDLPPSAYHWRVMATNDCGPTEFTASQAFTITWEPVETPSRWNPALGDEVCEASLHFYWSAVDRATFYQLQVDDSSDFLSPEIDDVTSGQTYWPADPIPLGSYYWQVRARNACGDGPWPSSEKWFTTIDGPATPELLSPGDGSSTCGTTPTFYWSPVSEVAYYAIQVDDDAAFGSPAINSSTPDPSYVPGSPLPPGTYFWRVYSYIHPCPSFWTPIRRFVIGSEPPPPPALVEPTPGGTVCSRTPLFDWTPGATAAAYQLQVDDDPGFPSPELDVVTTASDHVPTSALALGEQWVQVRAANACGDGPWSPAQSFAVATVPAPPLLSAPADGSRTPDMTPRFAWSPASGTASYHFQLAAESAFSSPLIDTTTPGAEYTPGRELAPGTYYWRVHTSNSCGTSAWAQAWTLTCLNASYVYLPLVVR